MSRKQALNHAVPILLCVLVGISGERQIANQPGIGLAIVACAVSGVAFGLWKLFRPAQSDDASLMSPWPFFFLANVIDGFLVRADLAGLAVGTVATLALIFLLAMRIRRTFGRKAADLGSSGAKG
jgi:hypothetical protein